MHPKDKSKIADRIARGCIADYIYDAVMGDTCAFLKDAVVEELSESDKKKLHDDLFSALFKAIDPYEKKFADMLRGIWEKERKIIIANIRKLRKAYMGKDPGDTAGSLLYPSGTFVEEVSEEAGSTLFNVVEEGGSRALDPFELGLDFDAENPEVAKWLDDYAMTFAKSFEGTSVDKLKRELIAGLEAGEGIPQLTKRVNNVFDDWARRRAEMVARSEIMRASNAGAKFAYKQSGVVKKIMWITYIDDRTCDYCYQLDGRIIGIEQNFFDLGETFTITNEAGKQMSMDLNYDNVGQPPLHPLCRCTIGAVFGDVIGSIKDTARSLYNKAVEFEPLVTKHMKKIAGQSNATLRKLQFRIKTLKSIKRKLTNLAKETPKPSIQHLAKGLKDTVRYTAVFPEEGFAGNVTSMHNQLQAQGFKLEKVSNYFGEKGAYQGINAKYIDPASGKTLELQFHTKQSASIVEKNHPLYERARVSTDPKEVTRLNKEMADNWEGFRMPDGAENLFN